MNHYNFTIYIPEALAKEWAVKLVKKFFINKLSSCCVDFSGIHIKVQLYQAAFSGINISVVDKLGHAFPSEKQVQADIIPKLYHYLKQTKQHILAQELVRVCNSLSIYKYNKYLSRWIKQHNQMEEKSYIQGELNL